MSRAERLLQLMQVLRRHRQPVAGAALAGELGISIRTLYRDIASLQAQGASIDGQAGLGYVLRPGFMRPPLMFSQEELEALVLGSRWVAERTDSRLAQAARDALAKVAAVLPPDLRQALDTSSLLVPRQPAAAGDQELVRIREAIRHERKLSACWPPGASSARNTAISAPTASRRCRSWRRPIRRRHALRKEWRQIKGILAR